MNGKGSKRRTEDASAVAEGWGIINWNSRQAPAKPQRIQRRRTKGYDMQAESRALNGRECVSVCRPGPWGNPFKLKRVTVADLSPAQAVQMFRDRLALAIEHEASPGSVAHPGYDFIRIAQHLEELRGKNMACFCPLGQPCHADILLEFANQ